MNRKLSIPARMEIIFDMFYLISAAVVGGIFLFTSSSEMTWRWGIMALVLVCGDAFHLAPRMISSYYGERKPCTRALGIGKLITSITMALFYILLWENGLLFFGIQKHPLTPVIYGLVALRIFLCLLPQNKWNEGGKETAIGICRNIPFVIQGILVMWLYASNINGPGFAVNSVWIAILISFICYLPVVLWVHKKPKLGMLMLPKTCAYLWIVCIGFWV